jgi:hypothetical protein
VSGGRRGERAPTQLEDLGRPRCQPLVVAVGMEGPPNEGRVTKTQANGGKHVPCHDLGVIGIIIVAN